MKEITERTLRVENVSLGYGEKTIVKDLSLEFPKGKITAIIGPNGLRQIYPAARCLPTAQAA